MVGRARGVVGVACAAVVLLVLLASGVRTPPHTPGAGSAGRGWGGGVGVGLLGGREGEIERFKRAQARLDRADSPNGDTPRLGVDGMIEENEAEGEGLAASMQERRRGRAQRRPHGVVWQALRDADAALSKVGMRSDRKGLLGKLRSSDIIGVMGATGQVPTRRREARQGDSLSRELRASQRQLGGMMAGRSGARSAAADEGLGQTALNTVAKGLSQGLDVRHLDPSDGLRSGQLAVADSRAADRIARGELRGVASGRLRAGGTLVGLGQ